MDPRMIIADTMDILRKAGMSDKELWAELDNCEGPMDAIKICWKWQGLARQEENVS